MWDYYIGACEQNLQDEENSEEEMVNIWLGYLW